MATWARLKQQRDNGETVEMTAPYILSASRSTDIPAFYASWFFNRMQKGYFKWMNPFNNAAHYISTKNVQFIVFWTKNPAPLLPYLHLLVKQNIGFYIQYTLNDYESEGLEKAVPPLSKRLDTFKLIAEKYGSERVIWRFDPLILTDCINEDLLIAKIQRIAGQLHGYTEKLVFSFADITNYAKVRRNLALNGVKYVDWVPERMRSFTAKLTQLNRSFGLKLATCGEKIDLSPFGVCHNRCIDDELMIRIAHDNPVLMQFLGVEFHETLGTDLFGNSKPLPTNAVELANGRYALHAKNKDSGQREYCGCIQSKDIGSYNTCAHLCEYCYANASKELAIENFRKHQANPLGESII